MALECHQRRVLRALPLCALVPRMSRCSWVHSDGSTGLILGVFTRWAGIFCAIHFAIAIAMVDRHGGMRGVFPSGCLVFIGLYLATYGAGRLSIDAAMRANEAPRTMGSVRLKK